MIPFYTTDNQLSFWKTYLDEHKKKDPLEVDVRCDSSKIGAVGLREPRLRYGTQMISVASASRMTRT